MKTVKIETTGTYTTYTSKNPFKVNENGTGIYNVLVVFTHPTRGRFIYDKFTVVK